MTQFQIGSISTGTLRTEDLLPAFESALEALGGAIDTGDWNDPEQATWDMAAFESALNDRCPPFVYFGTLPGDGADFGFWVDMERIQETLTAATIGHTLTLPRTGEWEWTLEDDGVIVATNDHGNVTVMDLERNVLWAVV